MNYLNSFTVEKLKSYYGKYFYNIFGPFYLFGSGTVGESANINFPKTISSNTHTVLPFLSYTADNTYVPIKPSLISNSSLDVMINRGAGQVLLSGVDENYKRITDIVTLTGTVEAVANKTFRFINKAEVYNSGNLPNDTRNLLNSGKIEIGMGPEDGSNNTLTYPWLTIPVQDGCSTQAAYALHSEETVFITKIKLTCSSRVSGVFSMWGTSRSEVVMDRPYKILTSVFNSENVNEVIFEEPYVISNSTIFFAIDTITAKAHIGIEVCGFKTDGINDDGVKSALENYKEKFNYKTIDRNNIRSKEKITKRALRDDSFWTRAKIKNRNRKL